MTEHEKTALTMRSEARREIENDNEEGLRFSDAFDPESKNYARARAIFLEMAGAAERRRAEQEKKAKLDDDAPEEQ